MGKNKHSKVMGFSNILGEAEIHAIPKTWEKWIYKEWEKYGKTHKFPILFATLQGWWEPMQFLMFGNVKIPIKWKYSVESHMIPKLWVFKEITKLLHNPNNPQTVGNVTFHTMGIFPYYVLWIKICWI